MEEWKEWQEVTLGEVCEMGDGAHSKIKRLNNGIMYLTSKNIKNGNLDLTKVDYISNEDYIKFFGKSKNSIRNLETGDILLSIIGSIGNVYIYKDTDLFGISSSIAILRPLNNNISSEFIFYLISSDYFNKLLLKVKGGSVQSYTNLPLLRGLNISIPSFPEQKAIAKTLSCLDEKIELNQKMNKTLEEMAQAIFKSWFVDFEPFGGVMPDDWESGTFDKIIFFQNGYAFKSKELLSQSETDTYDVFKQGHIKRGGGFNSSGTKSWFPIQSSEKLQKYILKKGDVLMAMTDMKDNVAILGNTAVMPVDDCYILNQRVALLRSNGYKDIEYPFINLLTNNENFLLDLRSRANSGVQVNLSAAEIKLTKIKIPTEDINKKFSDITIPIYEQMIANNIQNEKLKNTRDTLLPKLMSGEVRVPVWEVE